MGRLFNFFVRLVLGLNFCDTQCGFKGFDKRVTDAILKYSKINNFGFDVEVLYVAVKLRFKIKEVPIRWEDSPDSKVNIFKDPWEMFRGLFAIKKIHADLKA